MKFESASSKFNTMQDIVLQKSTELKLEGIKSVPLRQEKNPVTWPSKQEIGPGLIL